MTNFHTNEEVGASEKPQMCYKSLVEPMLWSYSRAKAFSDCPYRWYLKYIRHIRGKDMFFATFGSFMHELIEYYCKGLKTKDEIIEIYLKEFKQHVKGSAPNVKMFKSRYSSGLEYLKNLKPFPFNVLGVEKKVEFEVDGYPMIGYIDLLCEKDGDIYIIDHKSKNLKPRSTRQKPTKTDIELDDYLRQLYLYSIAVEKEYGQKPKALCFNCFLTETFIQEPFITSEQCKARKWFSDNVKEITNASDFSPKPEYFKCRNLCEVHDYCSQYAQFR